MEKLSKDDKCLLCFQVFVTALMLPTAIIYMWQGDYQLMMIDSFCAALNSVFALINMDRWTGHGKYNNEFFSQKAW